MTAENYGGLERPKVTMGIIWEGDDDTSTYQYTLRQNQTGYNVPSNAARPGALTTPDTSRKFDHFGAWYMVKNPRLGRKQWVAVAMRTLKRD